MPKKRVDLKRIRKQEERRLRNRSNRSRARTFVKRAITAIESPDVDLEAARSELQLAISVLDRTARKGAIHRNAAARRKSRLMRRFNSLAAETAAAS